jgi:hypothetical protein
MTENYSSENIKIREKLSMHMRHNFCSVNFQIQNFLRAKSALSANHKITKSEDKTSPLKTTKSTNIPGKFPTYKSAPAHLYDLLTSVVHIVRTVDVSLYGPVAAQKTHTCGLVLLPHTCGLLFCCTTVTRVTVRTCSVPHVRTCTGPVFFHTCDCTLLTRAACTFFLTRAACFLSPLSHVWSSSLAENRKIESPRNPRPDLPKLQKFPC